MSLGKRMDEKGYKAIKAMLNGGATFQDCMDYAGVGVSTVQRIKKSKDFDGYKELIREQNEKYLKSKAVKEPAKNTAPSPAPAVVIPDLKLPGGTMSGAYQINRIVELLKQQNETLTRISNKLAYIVEELTN